MIGGIEGIADTAQAAGRFADRHLPAIPGLEAVDSKIDNFPLSANLNQALEADRPYAAQQSSGKILQGAVSGLTGAALTGGIGAIPAAFGASVGAAVPTAKALGASDDTANDIGMALSLAPVAGAAGMATRTVAGNAARGAFLDSVGRTMTPAEAAQTVRAGAALDRYGTNGPQAQASYANDLNSTVGQYRRAAATVGYIDPEDGRAISQAATLANSGATAPGTASAGVRALGLPGYHGDALTGAVDQLQAVNSLPSGGAPVGPMSSLVARAAPVAAGLSALGAAHGGDLLGAAELAGGAIAGQTVASPLLRLAGTVGDKILGTSMTPAEARLQAAQRVVSRAGMDTSGDPLGDLQAALSDAQGDFRDQQLNAQDQADQATLYAQADQAWKANAAQRAATETAWDKATSQRDRQNAAGQADPLAAGLWKEAEAQTSPNLALVTASQSRGYQADQAALASAAAQQIAQQTAAEARGRNLSDQAGNWLERQQIRGFKTANPGVPVLGAAPLAATDPQSLFEATAGRFGNPADPAQQTLMQDAQGQYQQAPAPAAPAPVAGSSGSPVGVATGAFRGQAVGVPQGHSTGPAGSLLGAPGAMPSSATPLPTLGALPSGGKALAQMQFADHYPGQPLPSPLELSSAVDDLAADGLIAPQLADHLHAGGAAPSRHLAANIADRVATGRGLPSILDPQVTASQDAQRQFAGAMQGQAQADVQAAFGGVSGVPNGATNGRPPIANLARWSSAASNYQRHAALMVHLAPTAVEKQALSQVAAEPTSAGKAAIRDQYLAAHPGDSSRFDPALMRGT